MSNGQLHDDKLFQGLNDRLSDYEAPYDGADWDAMSRALDKLPKTNQFRWKFSLNTIGIMLGIVGLTVLGVVIASGNGKSGNPPENKNVSVNTVATPPVVNATQQKPSQPAATTIAVSNSGNTQLSVPEINSQKDLMKPRRLQKDEIPFRLGDQIDPAKGFVFETKEDPALMKEHGDFKKPEVYYELDENGNSKPIRIKDSSNHINEIKPDSIPEQILGPEPAAPTEGQRIGFDQTP
jgi:hypothetical protein